jgi:hypothetical protein
MQTAGAQEIEDMSAKGLYPVTRAWIRDYVAMRDVARACANK